MTEAPTLDVVAVGSALVDVLCTVDDATLSALALAKGSMELVDLARSDEVYRAMPSTVEVSGGSAANTAAGVAALGGAVAFVGKVADDELGRVFAHQIRVAGVEFHPQVAPAVAGEAELQGTGRCLVMVTPDAERTMATHLGVANTLDDIPGSVVARSTVLYLEGYLWDLGPAKEAIRQAITAAHDADCSVALSLSDPFCVDRHRRELLDLVTNEVDVLFGNEEEVTRLFGAASVTAAVEAAEETGVLLAATLGPRGSVVTTGRGLVPVPAVPVDKVVDTTGAGDLYAAGFLYGLTHRLGPEECARLGSVSAAEIISHVGARPEADLADLARAAGLH